MNILVVDDERNIRLTLKDILADEGHAVYQAGDGPQALSVLEKEQIHLIILDVKLPGMSGIEVLKSIRQEQPAPEILMISGHGTIQTAVEAVKEGAFDFLEKPLSMARVLTAVRNLNQKLALQTRVQSDLDERLHRYRLVGTSREMETVRSMIDRIAPTASKVLIRGESGTGKELVAYAIHHQSDLKDQPFIRFNSAAIPLELVESELFGHEKGAFTGAAARKIGKLELAHSGTLFLDEIGDMDLAVQAKILRVIQEGTFERVGGRQTLKIQTRILAATHKNLEQMTREGTFREDLFYRLNVIPITIPPLRERLTDIPVLVDYFLDWYASEMKLEPKVMTREALKLLRSYPFPGNVRELKNLIERLCILVPGQEITCADLAPHLGPLDHTMISPHRDHLTLKAARMEFEKQFLRHQLQRHHWNISRTAENLGLHQSNLSRKIRELGIQR